jgi:hypothetical protein
LTAQRKENSTILLFLIQGYTIALLVDKMAPSRVDNSPIQGAANEDAAEQYKVCI